MALAVLRVAKHKGASSIGASDDHCQRLRETPNADNELKQYNRHPIGSDDLNRDIKQRMDEVLQGKQVRKDGVWAVEHIMSASPEVFSVHKEYENGKPVLKGNAKAVNQFVKSSIEWLRERYGDKNVVSVFVHMDETTPHIHAFVVPEHNGKMNAKHYLGGKQKMSEMQDSFAEKMKPIGIERGVRNSKAKHQDLQRFYGRVNEMLAQDEDLKKTVEQEVPLPNIQIPEKGLLESSEKYQRRLKEAITDDLKQFIKESRVLKEKIAKIALKPQIEIDKVKAKSSKQIYEANERARKEEYKTLMTSSKARKFDRILEIVKKNLSDPTKMVQGILDELSRDLGIKQNRGLKR